MRDLYLAHAWKHADLHTAARSAQWPGIGTCSGQMEDTIAFEEGLKGTLAKLDLPPDADVRDSNGFARRRTLAEWAEQEGLELSPPDMSAALEAPRSRRHHSHDGMTVATFITLVVAGAGAAAVVFHQPLLRILATL